MQRLLEDGNVLLLEDGSDRLLEDVSTPGVQTIGPNMSLVGELAGTVSIVGRLAT